MSRHTEAEVISTPKKNSGNQNIVDDPGAPALYSLGSITGFSIFLTPLFGAVMLMANVADRKIKWLILSFGITSVLLAILLARLLPRTGAMGIAGGISLVFFNVLWNRYVGKDVRFRTRSLRTPWIISVVIVTLLILGVMYKRGSF